jgi:hypothetical protein
VAIAAASTSRKAQAVPARLVNVKRSAASLLKLKDLRKAQEKSPRLVVSAADRSIDRLPMHAGRCEVVKSTIHGSKLQVADLS